MTTVLTTGDSDAHAARSLRHPVLEAGNISFPNAQYTVDFMPQKGRACCSIRHKIERAALIQRFLDDGLARYCCAVSSPASSYRRMHVTLESSQTIEWEPSDMGEPPLFTPMIIAFESRTVRLRSDRDDVHSVWDGQVVEIEKGCRLAVGRVVWLKPTILNLLRFDMDDTLKEGTFRVDAESQPFRFVVKVSAELHGFLRYGESDPAWPHIMTHVVSACFALLKRDFSSNADDGSDHSSIDRNLEALADFLEENGVAHWTDGELFRPEEAATRLYPHLAAKGGQP